MIRDMFKTIVGIILRLVGWLISIFIVLILLGIIVAHFPVTELQNKDKKYISDLIKDGLVKEE